VLSLAGIVLTTVAMRDADVAEYLLVVAVALVVNAASTGALSIVADRYQARVIWLIPFSFALCLLAWRRQRGLAVLPSRGSYIRGDA
jgi:hypothetical protein